MWRRAGVAGIALSLGLVAAALGIAASDPVAFQKVGALSAAPLAPFDSETIVDAELILRAMPDRGVEGSNTTVYDVLPVRKRERTLRQGLGNCSSLVFGMAAELDARGQEYRIIHLMPLEYFLDGMGHTLLRAKFAMPEGPQLALLDVSAAAIPRSDGHLLQPEDLGRGGIPGLRLDPMRPESEDWTPFYAEDFQRDLMLGRITNVDLGRYFRFLEAVYVDVGLPPRVEKVLYDGLAVALGFYPTIHADRLDEARRRHALRFALHHASLWTLRLGPLVLLASACAALHGRRRSARRRFRV